ncbi:MAG: anaerobic sulfatase maturase [Parabacteroides distasonis]|nr:anaerobic sulfatase maturase [Parabacteroides distasonis]
MPDKHRHFAIVVKPVGSACNLRCHYCYYLDKQINYSTKIMSDDLLEAYIRQVIRIHGSEAEIEFAWHGGEPTIAGIAFFQKAIQLQAKYASNRKVLNTLQTNGTLLNKDWCRFFTDNDFRIGISIDGPQALHDTYRKDHSGQGTFHKVIRAIELLQKHQTSYNTLTTVNAANASKGTEVYHFIRSISDYMQFLPVVECADKTHNIALPPGLYSPNVTKPRQMAPFNVPAEAYGHFLCEVLDAWEQQDIGKKFVQIIEASIGNLTRRPAGLCVHEAVCGHCAAIEQNGDVYRCDRYVFDEYRMGNIQENNLDKLMESNRAFGKYKLESLPSKCLHCDVVELCWGGCPKDRLLEKLTLYGIERRNYLCSGYQIFFRHLKNSRIRNI